MWRPSLLFLIAAPLFAQLPSHTVTITATRSIVLQPDQAVFGVTVTSAETATVDQVVSALSGVGISSANLTGVSNSTPQMLQWDFTLAVPLANLAASIYSLTNLKPSIGATPLNLTFSVNGTQVSQPLQESQSCSNSDLIGDATAQAQKLADAAGMTLGPILSVSNAQSIQPSAAHLGYVNVGVFASFLLGAPSVSSLNCSANVEFQLLP